MTTENFLSRKRGLVDRLKAAAEEKPEALARNTHKIRFLAQQEDIIEARRAGWSLRQIWEELNKSSDFSGSYDLFVRYCRKYLSRPENTQPAISTSPGGNIPSVPVAPPATATTGFSYDGNPDPSKLY